MTPTMMRNLTLALVAAALLAAGCAKKTTPVQTPPAPPAAQPTTPAPTPTPTPTPAPPVPATPAASISDLATVYFGLDSYALDDAARAILDKDAKLLRENGWTVTIGGHCDERGTVEYNQALGERRAGAVKDYLVAAGVDGAKLKVVSYGKEMPADEGHDEAAWAKNRRAEFAR
jgi:peptidoglycan-associated lipoprotein